MSPAPPRKTATEEKPNPLYNPVMSQQLIGRYLNELSDLRRVSGDVRESVVREAFKTLLKDWGRSKKLIFVPEYRLDTATRDRRFVDGALLHELRVPFGYWEAKDEDDDLDKEIEKKFRRGYPQDNIIFEDSREAVLFQDRREVMRCPVDDPERLEKLLGLFFSHGGRRSPNSARPSRSSRPTCRRFWKRCAR